MSEWERLRWAHDADERLSYRKIINGTLKSESLSIHDHHHLFS